MLICRRREGEERCVWSCGDLHFQERVRGSALGCRDPGIDRAAYPHCTRGIELARKGEAIEVDRLFEANIVVGETAAYRTSQVHTLYPGMEVFESGVDTQVSDCAGAHMFDLRVPRCRPVDASDFAVASVDDHRIPETAIGQVVHLVDNFLLRDGRQIYQAGSEKVS